VLAKYFETRFPRSYWKGKRVIELGSGTGLLSVVTATLGLQNDSFFLFFFDLKLLQQTNNNNKKVRTQQQLTWKYGWSF
jgi:predicted nicotinamide N-methyase